MLCSPLHLLLQNYKCGFNCIFFPIIWIDYGLHFLQGLTILIIQLLLCFHSKWFPWFQFLCWKRHVPYRFFFVLGSCYIICCIHSNVKNYINSSCICYSSSPNSIVSSCQFYCMIDLSLRTLNHHLKHVLLYLTLFLVDFFSHSNLYDGCAIKILTKSIKKSRNIKIFFSDCLIYLKKTTNPTTRHKNLDFFSQIHFGDGYQMVSTTYLS